MLQNIISANHVSFILVFIEGLLSFLSPCVVPLIPIYMSYLAGNAKQTGEDGSITYQRRKVFFHTVFFVLGISAAFFLLGLSFSALGTFFKENRLLFTRIGGILIVILGLHQIGLLDFNFLQRERKLPIRLKGSSTNPVAAFLMGFTFSFAWTPCVGPALSSVLILASGAKSQLVGNLLVLLYSAGFVIPFLILGLFTTQVLNFLKGHQKILKYTVKVGGVLLIVIGIMTFTGWMNGISRYLNSFQPPAVTLDEEKEQTDDGSSSQSSSDSDVSLIGGGATSDTVDNSTPGNSSADSSTPDSSTSGGNSSDDGTSDNSTSDTASEDGKKPVPAFDFTLTDQYGNEHTLSDYKDKVVFLNFWATWCPPCKKEMPDIEELYQEYGENKEDVIILGVANPASDEYPNNSDVRKEEVIAFLDENGYTFPVVFDETGELLSSYYISAFPTTFIIDKNGNIYGYATGMLTKDIMVNSIEQAKAVSE
jgi:cytochrome c-type biogenesis protein